MGLLVHFLPFIQTVSFFSFAFTHTALLKNSHATKSYTAFSFIILYHCQSGTGPDYLHTPGMRQFTMFLVKQTIYTNRRLPTPTEINTSISAKLNGVTARSVLVVGSPYVSDLSYWSEDVSEKSSLQLDQSVLLNTICLTTTFKLRTVPHRSRQHCH